MQRLCLVLATGVATDYLNISGNDEDTQQLEQAVDLAQRMVLRRILAGKLLYWLVDSPTFRKACATCKNIVAKQVERGMQCRESSLAADNQAQKDMRAPKIKQTIAEELAMLDADPIALRDNLLASLLAARDNIAASLGWTFYFLARNPAVYARLRRDVLAQFGSQHSEIQITSESLKRCIYLQYCIMETLRLGAVDR